MKKKLMIVVLLIALLVPNFIYADKIINTDWVYDDTNSISEKTINYIYELNESELKDYQYAVYVTKTLNNSNMDTFKNKIFNEYGLGDKNKNSGILLVLTTEDREYGLEYGDGITGQLKEQLDQDFISSIAISDLKSGNWDKAVYKTSDHIKTLVIDSGAINTNTSIEENDLNKEYVDPRAVRLVWLFLISITCLITGVATIIYKTFISQEGKFFRGEEFKWYIQNYSLNKRKVKKDIKNNYIFGPRSEKLYKHLINTMLDNLQDNHSIRIDYFMIQSVFSESRFRSHEPTNVNDLSLKLHREYKQKIKAEKEIKEQKIRWIDKYVKSNPSNYSDSIINKIKNGVNTHPIYEESFIKQFKAQYRGFEIEDKLLELFPELDNRDISEIIKNLKKTKEYKDYINGTTDTFTPNSERIELSSYYARDKIGDISHTKSNNIWFWLWVYGMNSNKMHREQRIREESMRKKTNYSSRSNTKKNTNSFGSGFGGGFSSGGGFSGKF